MKETYIELDLGPGLFDSILKISLFRGKVQPIMTLFTEMSKQEGYVYEAFDRSLHLRGQGLTISVELLGTEAISIKSKTALEGKEYCHQLETEDARIAHNFVYSLIASIDPDHGKWSKL